MNQSANNSGKDILDDIARLLPTLPRAQRKIGEYVLSHPNEIPAVDIELLAQASGASQATIVRFARSLGLEGYAELRREISKSLGATHALHLTGADVPLTVDPGADLMSIAQGTIGISIAVLEDTFRKLDADALNEAFETLQSARHVYLVGVGSSAPIAMDGAQRLRRLGLHSVAIVDPHEQIVAACGLEKGDVVLAISYSGQTRDTIDAVKLAKEKGAKTLALTCFAESMLAKTADIVLIGGIRRGSPAGETLASRVSQLMILDVLCVLLAIKRDGVLARVTQIEEELAKKRYERRGTSGVNQPRSSSQHDIEGGDRA